MNGERNGLKKERKEKRIFSETVRNAYVLAMKNTAMKRTSIEGMAECFVNRELFPYFLFSLV